MPTPNASIALHMLQKAYPSDTEAGEIAEGAKLLLTAGSRIEQECLATLVLRILETSDVTIAAILGACKEVHTHVRDRFSGQEVLPTWPHVLADLQERCATEGLDVHVSTAIEAVSTMAGYESYCVLAGVKAILALRKAQRAQKKSEEELRKMPEPPPKSNRKKGP